jgi:hypothetical protein
MLTYCGGHQISQLVIIRSCCIASYRRSPSTMAQPARDFPFVMQSSRDGDIAQMKKRLDFMQCLPKWCVHLVHETIHRYSAYSSKLQVIWTLYAHGFIPMLPFVLLCSSLHLFGSHKRNNRSLLHRFFQVVSSTCINIINRKEQTKQMK